MPSFRSLTVTTLLLCGSCPIGRFPSADAGPTVLECAWQGEQNPEALTTIGCPFDFDALAAVPLDSSLPGARSVKFLIDRASLDVPLDQNACEPGCSAPDVCADVDGGRRCAPYTLYFQNTTARPLHFQFAREFLSGTCSCRQGCVDNCACDADSTCSDNCGCDTDCACACATLQRRCSLPPVIDLITFNATEYIMPQRRFLLGEVTYFEQLDLYVLTLAPVDTASPEMIEHMFRTVAGATFFGDRLAFRPASESQQRRVPLLPSDIPIVTNADIYAGLTYQPLNLGEAIGQVRILRARDLDQTYVSPRDIAVLDAVPNDISPVAAIVTAQFQTPLSHINVLSQNRGTPNMALRQAITNDAIRSLEGRWARLTVGANNWHIEEVSADEAAAWWSAQRPPPIDVPPLDLSLQSLIDLESISLDQISVVGAKAANFGELQRVTHSQRRYDFERPEDVGHLARDWVADGGVWQVRADPIAPSGGYVLAHDASAGSGHAALAPERWRNFSCRCLARIDAGEQAGLAFLRTAARSYYLLQAGADGSVTIERSRRDKRQLLAAASLAEGPGLLDLELTVHDGVVRARVQREEDSSAAELRLVLDQHPPGLSCGVWSRADSAVEFDQMELQPIYSPRGFAIPFFFFHDFMRAHGFDQALDELLTDHRYQSDGLFRRAALEQLRDAMEAAPIDIKLTRALEDRLRRDHPGQRMRFRSSTNAEDLGSYSGAGLYSSRSGAIDDPDRPVRDAVRRVWASLFNLRAFEEREVVGIDHHEVAMAILVHRSYPDELANGVAITANLFDASEPAFFINAQVGEESVTNPDPGVLPDQLLYYWASLNPDALYLSYSTINGGAPVMSRREVHELAVALRAIHNHFQPHYGARPFYAMDVEFKLDSPDRALVIKQARPYPGRGEP